MPPLSALVAFEAAARLGSFTRAADELALTQSAISRRIGFLEELLGLQLFVRVRNTVTLTEVGAFYAGRIQDALSGLANATHEATLYLGRSHLLRLGIPPTFGTRWLIPRIGRFLQDHPDIEIIFSTCVPGELDFTRDNLDAMIHCGDPVGAEVHFDKLLDERVVLVAHPDVAADLHTPDQLMARTLLVHANREDAWLSWFHAHGMARDARQAVLSFSMFTMVVQAAIDRLGVALVPELLVEQELAEGRLVAPFEGATVCTNSLFLAYPEDRGAHPPVQIFGKWLLQQCQHSAANQPALQPRNKAAPRREKPATSAGKATKAMANAPS